MLKYAKVINEETGRCDVGFGTDEAFYKSLGMTLQDVSQSNVDDCWYLSEKCPMIPEEQKRKQEFLKDFFKVGDYGYYRRQPKGYQSAVESMNVLFNIANVSKGLQGGLIIFYEEPDFTDPEQCTEEWLVAHQIIMEAMSLQDFLNLYVAFMTAWNTEEHETIKPEPQSDDELIEKPEEEEVEE